MRRQFVDGLDISKRAMEEYAKLHIKNAQENQKKVFVRSHSSRAKRDPQFKIGDWVDIRAPNNPKLRRRTVDPYKITRLKGENGTIVELQPETLHSGNNTVTQSVKDIMRSTRATTPTQ